MNAARALAGAVAGGVLAALLVDLDTATLVVVTLVAVVVGAAVAMLLVDTRAPATPAPQSQPNDWWSRPSAPPAPARAAAALPAPIEQPQRVVLGTGRGGQWWEKTGAPAGRPAAATNTVANAPELTSYVESARVVQCPRCGAFRIDVSRSGAEFSFHCNQDGHRWTWRPDTAWPLTVVVSRRRA